MNIKKSVGFGLVIILLIVITMSFVVSVVNHHCKDSDDDGVCDSVDKCLDSKPGERIDENGCDPFQFCEQFYCGVDCFYADFLKNEPEKKFPHDCTLVIINNEGSYEPKCVPIECKKNLKIPNYFVDMKLDFPGLESFYDIKLSNVPDGYDVVSGNYRAWCVDEYNLIIPNKKYNATLYSSYDPELESKCSYCYDEDWPKVNYILNHKQGSVKDVQNAIWYFVDGGHYPSDPDAQKMIEDAKSYGENFWPQEGENMAVIVDIGKKSQMTIIEVDP